jgi:hypothetical protein
MNTVEQFITNTIETYVEPLIEGFRRGRGKPKPPAQVAKEAGAAVASNSDLRKTPFWQTWWFWALILFVIIVVATNVMNYWTVNRVKEFTMSIPSKMTGAFSSATSVFSPKPVESTGGTISEVADISVTQA